MRSNDSNNPINQNLYPDLVLLLAMTAPSLLRLVQDQGRRRFETIRKFETVDLSSPSNTLSSSSSSHRFPSNQLKEFNF